MNMYDLINKKKNRGELTKEEIEFIVNGYTKGEIPDYQMAAFLMAVCINKMTHEETANLTLAMANSGEMLDLSRIEGVKVDKHSTGGVGDKTSLVIGPMVAPLAYRSPRCQEGLGHTGGPVTSLKAFRGFQRACQRKFIENVNRIKIAIVGQTANLAPADRKYTP